jgi:hypothetical protein
MYLQVKFELSKQISLLLLFIPYLVYLLTRNKEFDGMGIIKIRKKQKIGFNLIIQIHKHQY